MKILFFSMFYFLNYNEIINMKIIFILMITLTFYLSFKLMFSQMITMNLVLILFMFILMFYMKYMKNFYNNFLSPMKMMMFILMMSMMYFYSLNLIKFFIYFELSIIPMFMYMVFFSITEKKMISSLYLLVYTSIFSLIFIICMVMEIKFNSSGSLNLLNYNLFFSISMNKVLMILVFMTKLPIFFLHIWLPKAHVESSTFGSMILAGIMLKLGGYGLMILMNFNLSLLKMNMFLLFMLISSIMLITMCFFMNDIKMIIAYFSISHMMMMMMSLMVKMENNINFSILVMVSHSISSSILFMFNILFYKDFSSRMLNKIESMFSYSLMVPWVFFLTMMLNCSIPPSINFFGELMVTKNTLFFSMFFSFFLFFFFLFLE